MSSYIKKSLIEIFRYDQQHNRSIIGSRLHKRHLSTNSKCCTNITSLKFNKSGVDYYGKSIRN